MTSRLQARGTGIGAFDSAAEAGRLRIGLRRVGFGLLALAFLGLTLPVLAVSTPIGQRLVERSIELPLLQRLQAAIPAPFMLEVGAFETRVRPSSLEVELSDVSLTGPGLSVDLDQMQVQIRYLDAANSNLVPRRITVDVLRVALTAIGDQPVMAGEASLATSSPPAETGTTALPLTAVGGPDQPTSASDSAQLAALGIETSSQRLDAMLALLQVFDETLAHLTLDATWQSLRSATIGRIELAPDATSAVPILRDPPPLMLSITREDNTELIARFTGLGNNNPLSLVVRHAERGAPEGPSMLAEVAGSSSLEGRPFSHVLLHGVGVRDLTSALASNTPIAFDSQLAAEMVVTHALADRSIEQVALLLESGSGYLIASGREATILEMASIPMLYTRESGRFDIISAQIRFQETGGMFSGSIGPQLSPGGEAGLSIQLDAPAYAVAVPASAALERPLQRGSAQLQLRAHIPDQASRLDLSLMSLSLGDAVAGFSGSLDLGAAGSILTLAGQSTPMDAGQLAALWPMPLSPQARNWFLDNVSEGRLGAAQFTFAAALDDIQILDGRTYLRDDMMQLDVPYENLVLRTVGDLPAVFGLDGMIAVTGRTVLMTGERGVGRLRSGEMVEVGPVTFAIADHAVPDPPATLDLALAGPASAFVRMAAMDPITIDPQILPFQAEGLDGRVEMTSRLNAVLADRIDREAVELVTNAEIYDLAPRQPVDGRILTNGRFSLRADSNGLAVTGRAQLDGVPTDIAFSDVDGGGVSVAMQLDADARQRLGLDFGSYLSGTIGVDVGPEGPDGARRMDVDLSDAALSIPELGWRKARGVPAQASFDLLERGTQRSVRNLVIAANGLAVRGSLEFRAGDLRTAQFDNVAVEGIGRFSLAVARNGQGTTARLTGERLVLSPDLLRGDREAAGDLSLELAVGELMTREGGRLTNVRLNYAQSGERITAFEMRAQHADGTDLVGTLSPQGGASQLVISSGNAGTFLQFLGLYERARGGRATLVLDPASIGGRVAGQLLLNDYEIVDEPAMERIFSSGRSQAANSSSIVLPGEFETADRIEIQVTSITFDRTPERLIIRRAEGWGPSLGGNIEGTIDYAADAVSLSGTYVPFFTINNIFSRIPLLGTALGNRDTEGLLGITFELVGAVDSPQLRVNPMSILAPGAIRNIFEYQQ